MNEREPDYGSAARTPSRRGPDLFTLVAGLAALLASAYVLLGSPPLPDWLDLRWFLAVGAVVAGLLMLAASLRRKDPS